MLFGALKTFHHKGHEDHEETLIRNSGFEERDFRDRR